MTKAFVLVLLAVSAAFLLFCSSAAFAASPKSLLGWGLTKAYVPRTEPVSLIIHLHQRNLDVLERKFWEVSNPKHSAYGKYLSIDDITRIVSPERHVLKTIEMFLLQNNALEYSFFGNYDSVRVVFEKQQAEKLFQVQLQPFTHDLTGRRILRSLEPETVPEEIAEYVHFISGLSDFPPREGRKLITNKILKQKLGAMNPASDVKAGSTAPVIVVPRGMESAIKVTFNPVCANGQFTQDPKNPCSEYPPNISYVTATAFSNLAPAGTTFSSSVSLGPASCTLEPGSTNGISCDVTISGVTNYIPWNVTIQQIYADNSPSASATTQYPVVASPMVTPRTLAQLYNIPFNARVTHPAATQAVGEFEQQYYDPADLNLFFQAMGVKASNDDVKVIGPNDASNPGLEALLDIQWIMGLAPGAPTTFWSIYANSTVEIDDILQWALAMGNTTDAPIVNSLSYGMTEDNVDKYLGKGYLARSDVEFMKLALRGITIIIACGDTGAGDLGGEPMGADNCDTLHADWPSQSPYVTSVGSTFISPLAEPVCFNYAQSNNGITSCLSNPLGQIGVSVDAGMRWTTGGGFSNITSRPAYQEDFVEEYLNSGKPFPPSFAWNSKGRAYPDVVTVGHNLLVASNGQFVPVDGTSASAPIFAGMVTLLNDARLRAGLPQLGFLNPLLYQVAREVPEAFIDVTVGRNACGAIGTDPLCCDFGYEAAPGFDAVSGLGSPNFALLRDIILNMQPHF